MEWKSIIVQKYLILFLTILLILAGWTPSIAEPKWYQVKWIADGDTIYLQDGRSIRLIGINSPEVAHDDRPAEPYGEAAKKALSYLLKHQKVRLEWDQIRRDHYGRTLAHVFDRKNRLLSQVMVAKGMAHVLYHRNNERYFDRLLKSQQKAMAEKKGFWNAFQIPKKKKHFVGNERSLRFHAHTCKEGKKIYRKNKIVFTDAWNAFKQGYAPAKGCLKGIGMFME